MVIPLTWYLINTSNNVVSDKPQEFFFYVCVGGGGGGGNVQRCWHLKLPSSEPRQNVTKNQKSYQTVTFMTQIANEKRDKIKFTCDLAPILK